MKAHVTGNQTFLSDLDHLMQALARSFPQIHHARRKFDADLLAGADQLAGMLASAGQVYQPREFYALLQRYIFTPGVQRAGNRSWYSMDSNVGVLTDDFYLEFFLRSCQPSGRAYDDYLRGLLNKPAVVGFYTGLAAEGDYRDEIIRRAEVNRPILSARTERGKLPTVVTDVPVAGKVARVQVDVMGPNMLQDPAFYAALEDRLFAFYAAIADFEHLVFDVRGNPGGFTPFVERMLVGPHLQAPVELTGFVFFPGDAAGPDVGCCTQTFYDSARYPRMDIAQMLGQGLLPQLDPQDAAILASGAYNHWMTFSPTERRSPFKGQIWVLIDGGTGSAAEVFAILARQAGLARIVGAQSAGNYSKSRGQGSLFFMDLPQTGIMVTWDPVYFTDAQGRHAHEHHVIPDVPNRPGLDALETVLAVIEEQAR